MSKELIESISYCITSDPYTLISNIKLQKINVQNASKGTIDKPSDYD